MSGLIIAGLHLTNQEKIIEYMDTEFQLHDSFRVCPPCFVKLLGEANIRQYRHIQSHSCPLTYFACDLKSIHVPCSWTSMSIDATHWESATLCLIYFFSINCGGLFLTSAYTRKSSLPAKLQQGNHIVLLPSTPDTTWTDDTPRVMTRENSGGSNLLQTQERLTL